MFVSEMMSKCVTECTEDMGLSEVHELIRKCDHGLVVVIDSQAHRVPIGVVSERSICEQIIARGRNPRNLIAGSVMDSRIKTVSETDLAEALEFAGRDDIAAIVVIDKNRQVCGLIPKAVLAAARKSPSRSPRSAPEQTITPTRSPAIREIPAFGWVQ